MPTAVVIDTNRHESRYLVEHLAKSSDVILMTARYVDPSDSITSNVCEVLYGDPCSYHDVRQVIEMVDRESTATIDIYLPAPQDVYMGCQSTFTCDAFFQAVVSTDVKTRIFMGVSHDIYGTPGVKDIDAPFAPNTTLGIRQLHNYWTAQMFAQRYSLCLTIGILFSRESPRNEGVLNFVMDSIARVEVGSLDSINVPCLDAEYDMGCCKDFAPIYQREIREAAPGKPRVVVIGSGRTRKMRDLVVELFAETGIFITWERSGTSEVGIDTSIDRVYVTTDDRPCPAPCSSASGRVSFSAPYIREMLHHSIERHKVLRSTERRLTIEIPETS